MSDEPETPAESDDPRARIADILKRAHDEDERHHDDLLRDVRGVVDSLRDDAAPDP